MINLILCISLFLLLYIDLRKNNKICLVLSLLLLGILCYINDNLPDDANYKSFYDAVGNGVHNEFLGIGWWLLCWIGNLWKFDYSLFKTVIYILSLVLLLACINKITRKKQPVFMFYLFFPGILDLIQIRFFFATALVMLGFVFLLKKKGFLKYVLFLLFWIFSITVHNSCLFDGVFLFVPLLSKLKISKVLACILIVDLAFILFNGSIFNILTSILPASQTPRLEAYLKGDKTSFIGLAVYFAFLLAQYLLVYYLYRGKKSVSFETKKIGKYILYANALLLLSIPFIYLSSDFMRLQRAFLVINFSYFFLMMPRGKTLHKDVLGVNVSLKKICYFEVACYFCLFILAFNTNVISSFFNL